MFLVEKPDDYQQPPMKIHHLFADAWDTIRVDGNFRRLTIIAALFTTSILLFPHYQALARGERVALGMGDVVWWVIIQNAGTAVFSIVAGPVADWRGNRAVLRVIMLMVCVPPISAVALSHAGETGRDLFPTIFFLLGVTPVTFKILSNYVLEIAQPADHPRYLSTLRLCMSVPAVISPLIGVLIGPLGFDVVFLGIMALVAIGWWMTFGLEEPRRRDE